jgi:hypothetical protein
VAEADRGVFTLGRLPDGGPKRRFAEEMADRVEAVLAGRRLAYGEAGRALGLSPNALRYAAPTGRVVMRWDGARQPVIWTVPRPAIDPLEARLELARRHLHVCGPSTPAAFAAWAGIPPARARSTYDALAPELLAVRSPLGDAWVLAADEALLRASAPRSGAVRLLPSGDAYLLLQGADRELVVPDPALRAELWTPRVWPGGILLGGEVVGTWRRADAAVTLQAWRPLSAAECEAIADEATAMPLPGVAGRLTVTWLDASC